MTELQKRIKELRLKRGYTLSQLADLLNVKEATVQRYESGEIKNIKHHIIVQLASILNCSPSYLMGWEELPEIHLSPIEEQLIIKYRQNPQMQEAVNKLLGI